VNNSEQLVAHWLTNQRCHWVYIDQSPHFPADGVKRIEGRPQIHRPDFIALVDGLGSVAIDVKCYSFRSRKGLAFYDVPTQDSDPEADTDFGVLDMDYVKLSWSEIEGLLRFQRASNIPTWICILDRAKAEASAAFFYRADHIFDSFSWLFSPIPPSVAKPQARYFRDWPYLELAPDADVSNQNDLFDFVIEEETLAQHWSLMDWRCYVAPAVVNLSSGTSLFDLADIVPVVKNTERLPSDGQMNFATWIASTLKIELPALRTKSSFGHFIAQHVAAFRAVRAKAV